MYGLLSHYHYCCQVAGIDLYLMSMTLGAWIFPIGTALKKRKNSPILQQAKVIWIATATATLQKAKMEVEGCMNSLQSMADKCALTGQDKSFYFSS